jgi:hypothetical protein
MLRRPRICRREQRDPAQPVTAMSTPAMSTPAMSTPDGDDVSH